MTKLVKAAEPGWAISPRGKRITLANWDVMIDGVKAGRVHQVLCAGGRKLWYSTARSGLPGGGRRAVRAEAVADVERAHGRTDADSPVRAGEATR